MTTTSHRGCVVTCLCRAEPAAGISRYGITSDGQRQQPNEYRESLQGIAGDRSQWRELLAATMDQTSFIMSTSHHRITSRLLTGIAVSDKVLHMFAPYT